MKTTKKLLSIVLAAIMILSCCGMTSFAIDWPKDLDAGAVSVKGLSKISWVEVAIDSSFTKVAEDAEFTVYYSEESIADDILNITGLEKAGTVKAENAYVADGTLHISLSDLELTKEGYYYIYIASRALEYDGYYNLLAVTEGAQYQFASLDLISKLQVIISYIFSIFSNFISNGKAY